jgi:hypothetical protein
MTKRKIYIATKKEKDTDARLQAFGKLGDEFTETDNAADAEFIVLDCDDPAEFKVWVTAQAKLVVTERCYPPIILAKFGKGHVAFLERLADVYPHQVEHLHSCETPDELLKTLNKLQTTVPFYNARNAPAHGMRLTDVEAEAVIKRAVEIARSELSSPPR